MSKSAILQGLPHLSSADRQEILGMLWDLEDSDAMRAVGPTPEERIRLDDALAEFARDPNTGRPFLGLNPLPGVRRPARGRPVID